MTDLFQQMAEITQRLNRLLHEAGCVDWEFEQAQIQLPARAFDRMMHEAGKLTIQPRRDLATLVDSARVNAVNIRRVRKPS